MSGSLSVPHALGLSADEWQIRFSRGMPPNPAQEQDGSWSFRLPAKSQGEVDYVTRSYTKVIEKGRTLTATKRCAIEASIRGVVVLVSSIGGSADGRKLIRIDADVL
jgi:hypothetical protein